MKFCTKCGAQNTDEAQICIQCQSYLSTVYNVPKHNTKINTTTIINLFGILNGIAALILGIITFTLSSLREDTKYLLEKEMGENFDQILDIILAPTKAFSFGLGSLLIILGIFLVLFFANNLAKKTNFLTSRINFD